MLSSTRSLQRSLIPFPVPLPGSRAVPRWSPLLFPEETQQLLDEIFGAFFGKPMLAALDDTPPDVLGRLLYGAHSAAAKAALTTQGQHRRGTVPCPLEYPRARD
jgi:hypothetical protein